MTGKTAFVFSGQGAQYSGMGKALYEEFRLCKDIFDEADDALSLSLSAICFDEKNVGDLNKTEFCQPATLTLSVACQRLLAVAGVRADFMAGLSLGEYTALTCAGAFRFADAVCLVRQRGRFMTEAVPEGVGGMSAILGLEADRLEAACQEARGFGFVACANYNAPGQIVIAGETAALAEAERLALLYGARRAVRLNVSGPFHTPLLQPAAERLAVLLAQTAIGDMTVPVVSNTDARVIVAKEAIVPTLLQQIVSPVRWVESIRWFIGAGVDTFIEIGPGKTLSAFIRKISKEVTLYQIENPKTYEAVLSGLQQSGRL